MKVRALAARASLAALSLALAFAGAAHAATQPPAPMPVPDGAAACVWLRITAAAHVFELLPDDAGLGPRRTLKAICYMQLLYSPPDADNPHGRYSAPLLCPIDAANWGMSGTDDSFEGKALPDGNVIVDDKLLTFTNEAGDLFQGYGAHRLLISVDKNTGAFKKALFQTLGTDLIDTSFFFEDFLPVFGTYSATGVNVRPDKVPPEAAALVAGGPCGP